MTVTATSITIPADLLPADGRFGCGPSKIRPEALSALTDDGTSVLGVARDVDGSGRLVLDTADGSRTFGAGDVVHLR